MFGRKRNSNFTRGSYLYGKGPALIKSSKRPVSFNFPQKFKKNNEKSFLSKIKFFSTSLLLITIFVLIIYSIFFSNYFRTTEIAVVNQEFEEDSLHETIEKTLSPYLGKNLLFVNEKEIAEKIIKAFPQLENISVDKKYPKKLEIKFTKYPLAANIINESSSIKKTYIINQIGFVLKEDYENPELPYIRIKSEEPINIKKAIISKEKLKYILDSMIYFQDKFGMRIKEALYKPVAREIHLLTEKDFYIWLDMQIPFEEQLKKLKKTLVKLDIQKEPLYYIDLRISGQNGEKIIYKRK
jgi:hypothetical protein